MIVRAREKVHSQLVQATYQSVDVVDSRRRAPGCAGHAVLATRWGNRHAVFDKEPDGGGV